MTTPGKELLFLALGGSGEIGMNANLYGCDGKWIMLDLGVTFGMRDWFGNGEAEFQARQQGASASYASFRTDLQREQFLPRGFSAKVRFQGQASSGTLVTTEQFFLSGVDGVRGYLEGEVIGDDLMELFNYLTTGFTPKRNYRKLLPAPKLLKPALLDRIEREIRLHTTKNPGLIQFKMNALEDADVVRALYRAAQDRLDRRQYKVAAALFDEVERQHPYSPWARRAQLMSAFSYYMDREYTPAIEAAQRLENGDLKVRITSLMPEELAVVGRAFDAAAERLSQAVSHIGTAARTVDPSGKNRNPDMAGDYSTGILYALLGVGVAM